MIGRLLIYIFSFLLFILTQVNNSRLEQNFLHKPRKAFWSLCSSCLVKHKLTFMLDVVKLGDIILIVPDKDFASWLISFIVFTPLQKKPKAFPSLGSSCLVKRTFIHFYAWRCSVWGDFILFVLDKDLALCFICFNWLYPSVGCIGLIKYLA